jgi:hypothetical protein
MRHLLGTIEMYLLFGRPTLVDTYEQSVQPKSRRKRRHNKKKSKKRALSARTHRR